MRRVTTEQWALRLDILASLTTIVGVIATVAGVGLGVVVFVRDRADAKWARDVDAFDQVNQAYGNFLALTLEHPDFEVFAWNEIPDGWTEPNVREHLILYDILFNMFERAFVLCDGASGEFRARQWAAWRGFIIDWSTQARFREAWGAIGSDYDERFMAFMDSTVLAAENATLETGSL